MVEGFERVINSFRATWDVSIFITGSNAKLLSGELATLLTGRYVSFYVMPVSFRECCEIRNVAQPTDEDLVEYMNWGGMPQRFSMEGEEQIRTFLQDLYNSVVLRDIVQRTGAKDVNLLNRIMEYLMANPSRRFRKRAFELFQKCGQNRQHTDPVQLSGAYRDVDDCAKSAPLRHQGENRC